MLRSWISAGEFLIGINSSNTQYSSRPLVKPSVRFEWRNGGDRLMETAVARRRQWCPRSTRRSWRGTEMIRPKPGIRHSVRRPKAAVSLLLGHIGLWSEREIDASQAERLGRLSIARSALSLARSAQAKRDNESCFFVHAAGVHRFIRRYHVKNSKIAFHVSSHARTHARAVRGAHVCYYCTRPYDGPPPIAPPSSLNHRRARDVPLSRRRPRRTQIDAAAPAPPPAVSARTKNHHKSRMEMESNGPADDSGAPAPAGAGRSASLGAANRSRIHVTYVFKWGKRNASLV
ncbi:hypothetical protein EVAR_53380_1 [Eumeta japonica]|uniref:Uncharacterized protein n=1 Tax=Eumeta variegata TaxID=151549 RepID=A0A4C1Y6H3_EUMVA|nr:hypothetical protein EVAR_53380_1 [Eumeta japonica]